MSNKTIKIPVKQLLYQLAYEMGRLAPSYYNYKKTVESAKEVFHKKAMNILEIENEDCSKRD